MMEKTDNRLIGFSASYNSGEPQQEFINNYLWGQNGFNEKLSHLQYDNYGEELEIILFRIHVKPFHYERKHLKEIENYRRKEKSISIPIILDDTNFFGLSETEREQFFVKTIIEKLELVELKVKRNKLNFDILQLIDDVKKIS